MSRRKRPRPVTPAEFEADVLAFIAERYEGRHLDIDVARFALANVAARLVFAHLKAVAGG